MLDRLDWDAEQDARKAKANGWHIDSDGWWTRARKAGDIVIRDASHFGFTMHDHPENSVYVRSALFALSYDRGVVPPFKK